MDGTVYTGNVVLHLMKGKLKLEHSLHMDNFYNSQALAKQLQEAKTYCTGTLRSERKNRIEEVEGKKLHRANIQIVSWKASAVIYTSIFRHNKKITQ